VVAKRKNMVLARGMGMLLKGKKWKESLAGEITANLGGREVGRERSKTKSG